MAKPTTPIPSYATDATFTSGIETGLAPTLAMSGAEVTQGVKPGKLVARKFNWLVKLIVDWVRHIEGSRPDFVAGDSVYQEGNVTLNCAPGVGLALTGGPSTDFSVDRACTFTQTVGLTDDLTLESNMLCKGDAETYGDLVVGDFLTVHESATINGDCSASNLRAELKVEAHTVLSSKGALATGSVSVALAANERYNIPLNKATIYISESGAGSIVGVPVVAATIPAQPYYQFMVVNGGSNIVSIASGSSVMCVLPAGSAAFLHWDNTSWQYVTGMGTSAGSFTPT